jgi:hypothetical protein
MLEVGSGMQMLCNIRLSAKDYLLSAATVKG